METKPLRSRTFLRESGLVLLGSLLVVMVLFGTMTLILNFSSTEARQLTNRAEALVALQLAEGGIEAAKAEIMEGLDVDGDGLGSVAGSGLQGSFSVDAVRVGDLYEVTATGSTTTGSTVWVESILEPQFGSVFPGAAISFVGNMTVDEVDFGVGNKHTSVHDLVLDGGSGPALSFSDLDAYNNMGAWFAESMANPLNPFPPENLDGGVTNTFNYMGTDYDLAIAYEPNPDERLADLQGLYLELDQLANNKISEATSYASLPSGTYGDPDNPVTMYIPGWVSTTMNSTITGYGTLIVDRLTLNRTTFNWTGDVFVIGAGGGGRLHANGSKSTTIDGNLMIIGEGVAENTLHLENGNDLTVNGNLVFAADWNANTEAELEMEDSSTLTVNGILTMMGREIDFDTEDGDSVFVNGMMQLAVANNATPVEVDIEFKRFEVHIDQDMIFQAARMFHDLGVESSVAAVDNIVGGEGAQTRTWRKMRSVEGGPDGKAKKPKKDKGNGNGNGNGNGP